MIARWRDIVKREFTDNPVAAGRNTTSRNISGMKESLEEQLQLAIQNIESGQRHQQPQGFQPPERRYENWMVDTFWGVDSPQRRQSHQEDKPGPS